MTTAITVINHGPEKVRVRLRNVSKSARHNDSDSSEVILEPNGEARHLHVYDIRKIIVEEYVP